MVVHLVAKSCFSDLIQTLELVEADGVTVRHDEPLKESGKALLAEGVDFFGFPKHFRPSRDEDLLKVVRVDVRRHKTKKPTRSASNAWPFSFTGSSCRTV